MYDRPPPPCHCDTAPLERACAHARGTRRPRRGDEHFRRKQIGERSSSISKLQSTALCLLHCEPPPPQACAGWVSDCLPRMEQLRRLTLPRPAPPVRYKTLHNTGGSSPCRCCALSTFSATQRRRLRHVSSASGCRLAKRNARKKTAWAGTRRSQTSVVFGRWSGPLPGPHDAGRFHTEAGFLQRAR